MNVPVSGQTVNVDHVKDLAREAQGDYQRDLAALVAIDSGSRDSHGVNRAGDWVAERLEEIGFFVERKFAPEAAFGNAVIGRKSGSGEKRIVVFAHLDTVFEVGDAAARPFRVDERGHGRGPGVTDDKAGVIACLHAARHLSTLKAERFGELVLVFTPDEEIGSPFGKDVLEEMTANADAALCMECARENGDLVVARKGVVDLKIEVTGKAAHSGIEPERGAHAGLEAARLTIFLQSLGNANAGVTVNVGILRSGDRVNIVPERASLQIEVRSPTMARLDQLLETIRLRLEAPETPGTSLEIVEIDRCPPMEETEENLAIAVRAQAIAHALGFDVGLARTGGVSDANRVAARGIPTLDGLGPIGGGDHTEDEWLDLASVPHRVAMLAALIDDLSA